MLRRLVNELPKFSYRFKDEKTLHSGIAEVLDLLGVSYQREFAVDEKNRFDFFLEGVVIEAKIDGGFGAACHQCDRYMQLDIVKAVAVVTSRNWPATATHLRKKRFSVINVKRRAF